MINLPKMTNNELKKISCFVEENMGIKMPPVKKNLLEARISKRLRVLGYKSFKEYFNYLFSDKGYKEEIVPLFNVISTNKTDFFREKQHFHFLENKLIPELLNLKIGINSPINIWCAGCSTGEEPYTIAMIIENFKNKKNKQEIKYSILGTDISTEALKTALRAIYNEDRLTGLSKYYRYNFMMKSKNKAKKEYRIIPQIRKNIKFQRINLMNNEFPIKNQFDIIFCRNVLIYFNKKIQEQILKKILIYLNTGGFLFIGHSESLFGFNLNTRLKTIESTIFRKIR